MVYLISIVIAMPIFATLFIYIISNKIVRHKRKAFHIAINWTTLLYIISTTELLFVIFTKYYIGIIIGIILLILIIVILYQWKTKTEIVFGKAVKVSWRIYFLLFSISYVLLLVIGIIQRIVFY